MFILQFAQTNVIPGAEISGTVSWNFPPPRRPRIEIRLIWYTLGKGDRDHAIAAVHKVSAPDPEGATAVRFVAPVYPNSFSGKLVSVCWALEAIAFPDLESARVELTIGPGGQELGSASRSDGATLTSDGDDLEDDDADDDE